MSTTRILYQEDWCTGGHREPLELDTPTCVGVGTPGAWEDTLDIGVSTIPYSRRFPGNPLSRSLHPTPLSGVHVCPTPDSSPCPRSVGPHA